MFNVFVIYVCGLLVSGPLPVLAYLCLSKNGKDQVSPLIIAWFLLRFLADAGSYIAHQNHQDLRHIYYFEQVTVCIEFTLMMLYFVKLKNWNHKPMGWILVVIPLLIYLFEIFLGSPATDFGELLLTAYFLVIALLFLSLMFQPTKWEKGQSIIIWSFFLYHAFFVIYGVIQTDMRTSSNLMHLIYPFFWLGIVGFNVFFAYFLWNLKRNEGGNLLPHEQTLSTLELSLPQRRNQQENMRI
jgi:hypothetical protein